MAVELGDQASGFRYVEVVKFINNEIRLNGGGPEFYTTFCLRPWNEIEDQLCAILVDPQVPRFLKRAYTWSALALSVRVGGRQHEQQLYELTRPLMSELWQLRQQREETTGQLLSTQDSLQQAVRECDILCQRVIQLERSAQVIPVAHGTVPGPQSIHLGATLVPVNVEPSRVRGAVGEQYVEAQMSPVTGVFYAPRAPSAWSVHMQPPLPVPMPCQFPPHSSFPARSMVMAPLSSSVVMGTNGGAVPIQMPMPPAYPSAPLATTGPRGIATVWKSKYYVVPENSQVSQQSVVESISTTLEEGDAEKSQEMETVGKSRGRTQEEDPQETKKMASEVGIDMDIAKQDLLNPEETSSPLESELHSQDPMNSQALETMGHNGSHDQQEGVGVAQAGPVWESCSQAVREAPKTEQPQEQKPIQPQSERVSVNQSVSSFALGNWDCPRCKAINFSWRKVCNKCKKIHMSLDFGDFDPDQPY